jgi:predicted alpha/beta-fold hydrolase
MRPYEPLFRNPHLSTVLANFWPRKFDFSRFPARREYIQTDPDTQVLVETNLPDREPRAEAILVHGLEGGSDSGYMLTLAWTLLHAGFVTHRFNIRTCGGTGKLAKTLYHAGLTHDLRFFLEHRHAAASGLPIFLAGFSLGGNVSLKLAGELGATDLLAGVCCVSTPLDLAAGVKRLARRDNYFYERRFVKRMRKRLLATGRYSPEQLENAHSIYDIDDRITAPSFGFRGADHYYETQSAQNFLDSIRVPTLLIQSKDDTYIPFETYSHPALRSNPAIHLAITEHGGHLGFLNRRGYRFWIDEAVAGFFLNLLETRGPDLIAAGRPPQSASAP